MQYVNTDNLFPFLFHELFCTASCPGQVFPDAIRRNAKQFGNYLITHFKVIFKVKQFFLFSRQMGKGVT